MCVSRGGGGGSIQLKEYLKVPLLSVTKGSYFCFGSPQQQIDMHARSKTLYFSYNMHYFYIICSTTPERFAQVILSTPSFVLR